MDIGLGEESDSFGSEERVMIIEDAAEQIFEELLLECDDIISTQTIRKRILKQIIPHLPIPTSAPSDDAKESNEPSIKTDTGSIRAYVEEIFASV
jgi:hypothetical protein